MFDDTGNLLDAYKKLIEDHAKRDMDRLTVFMHKDTRIELELAPVFRDGELASLDIVESSHIAPGEVYMVPQEKVRPSMGSLGIALQGLAPSLQQFSSVNALMLGGFVRQGFSLFGEYGPEIFAPAEVKAYRWERRNGETLVVWAIRLDEKGLLDQPDIRRAYQKTVIVGLATWIRDLVKRLNPL